ncbi:MAG TPA: hypothetical protein VH413_09450 [Verrucomicrobiae bacterium]|jgi:hypothetical protein|nr:hypothetical protein [Verrucomicrobiae bacterium]
MKKLIPFAAILLAAGTLLAADASKDDLSNAIKKLAASDNYSWTTSTDGGRFTSSTEGKAEKMGYTTLDITMGDNVNHAVLKDGKGAIKTDGDWQSVADAAKDDGGGGFSPGRFFALTMQNYKAPAADAESLLAKTQDIKMADGAYSADLTEDGAKERLTFRRGGGNGPEVSNAKGSVKFWVKDGMLSKYQLTTSGHIEFNGNGRDINRTMTVEIKDIGKTKVEVPDDAKKKISS